MARPGGPAAQGLGAAALIRRLPDEPVVDLATARSLTDASAQATLGGIDRLVAAGVLREPSGRRRNRLWESVGLFALLDDLETSVRGATRRRARTDAPIAEGARPR